MSQRAKVNYHLAPYISSRFLLACILDFAILELRGERSHRAPPPTSHDNGLVFRQNQTLCIKERARKKRKQLIKGNCNITEDLLVARDSLTFSPTLKTLMARGQRGAGQALDWLRKLASQEKRADE